MKWTERCNYLSFNHGNGDFFTFEDNMIVSPGIFFGVYIMNSYLSEMKMRWQLWQAHCIFLCCFIFDRICSSHYPVVWQRSFNWERLDNKWVSATIGTQHPVRPRAPCAYTSSVATSVTCSAHVPEEYTWFAACQHTDNFMQGWLQVFI